VQPVLRRPLETAAEQPKHLGGHGRRKGGPVQLLAQDAGQHVAEGVSREERLAGEHLVEEHPEGPDVGALVDRLAARLLGRHVGGGAED